MEKITFLVEKLSTEETTLSSTMLDALAVSDNFTSNYKLASFQSMELGVANLEHDSEDIFIDCPYCKHCEQQPIDQQRHRLQTIQLSEWLKDKDGIERSLMKCLECNEDFIQLWNYKKEEELPLLDWDYHITGNNIFIDGDSDLADWGTVVARTEEEAINLARVELQNKIKELNKRLEGTGATLRLDESVSIYVSSE